MDENKVEGAEQPAHTESQNEDQGDISKAENTTEQTKEGAVPSGTAEGGSTARAEGRPLQDSSKNERGLLYATLNTEKALSSIWNQTRGVLIDLRGMQDPTERKIDTAETLSKEYEQTWNKLQRLYQQDKTPEGKEHAELTEISFNRNIEQANEYINDAKTRRAENSALNFKSPSERGSTQGSLRSSHRTRSSTSSRTNALKAQGKARSAAREAEYMKTIAHHQAKIKVIEAEMKAEKARIDAETLQQVAEENSLPVQTLTTPDQSSNDHVSRYIAMKREMKHDPLPTLNFTEFVPKAQNKDLESSPLLIQPGQGTPTESGETVTPTSNQQTPTTSQNNNNIQPLTEIAQMMARQRLPLQQPITFGGDPTMYMSWKRSFEATVTTACIQTSEKLDFLHKYTQGDPQKIVEDHLQRYVDDPDESYREAWIELEDRFGNPAVITAVILERLKSFPKVKPDESKKLLELSDLCSNTEAHIRKLPDLSSLNTPQGLKPVMEKLPRFVLNKWRDNVDHTNDATKHFLHSSSSKTS
ncbi:uncharacterized protein [Ptychodera flava]|uniref:uncharacterized protein n=1 Tax=Ptychodera flava TaxID=63121 RepID=UPI00396A3AF7